MGIALQVAAVVTEKFIANKIQRRRHMTATVDVCVKVAPIVDENGVEPVLLADQPEFLYGARLQFIYPRNHAASGAAFGRHAVAVANEYPTPDRQADQIDRQKNQR